MRFIEVAGTRLVVRESGAGPLALFIHGFPLDFTMWLDQLAALASVRHCVAPDLRGFGASDPSSEPTLPMERHADDLAALVGALGDDRADDEALSMGRLRRPRPVGAPPPDSPLPHPVVHPLAGRRRGRSQTARGERRTGAA